MTSYSVIGDIAGQYDTLLALLAKMPKDATPFSLGDMVDRGPKSREVLEFFRKNGIALLGNHEHMMLDHLTQGGFYEPRLWTNYNGGYQTLESFEGYDINEYISYLKSLPMYLTFGGSDDYPNGLFASHAPKNPTLSLGITSDLGSGFWRSTGSHGHTDSTLIWNRGNIKEMSGVLQVHGHNSFKKVHYYGSEIKPFGVNLDTSAAKILTGLHWPSMEIFQQEYI